MPSAADLAALAGPKASWRLGLGELVQRLRSGELSAVGVIAAQLARVVAVNGRANAVTAIVEQALPDAASADRRVLVGETVLGLQGAPFSVKESIDVAGSATTRGLASRAGELASGDDPIVERLRSSGAIPLLRTNLPERGMRWHTDNELHGATRNPFDSRRSSGGSSGGDAVAVATGMVPFGIGSDLGGSLRLPAQFCGVAALRPTLGRYPRLETESDRSLASALMTVQGPIARTVADIRLLDHHLLVGDPPAQRHEPLSSRISVVRADDPQVDSGIVWAASALAEAGYELTDERPPKVGEAFAIWRDLAHADARALLASHRAEFGADTLRFIELSFQLSRSLDPSSYDEQLRRRDELAAVWSEFERSCPFVLGPISSHRPFLVGRDVRDVASVAEILDSLQLTLAASLLDRPALVVPVGLAEGLPQAVQLLGPPGEEADLFNVAEALERRTGRITPVDPV